MECVGFSLIGLVVAEVLLLFRAPLAAPESNTTILRRRMQFWIQDLLLAIVWYGAFLSIFKPEEETLRMVYSALLPAAGFIAAMDAFSLYPRLYAGWLRRGVVMVASLTAFTFGWQICFLGWWLFHCVRGIMRRRDAGFAVRRALLIILGAYGAAFFLPVDIGALAGAFKGYDAFGSCWQELYKKFEPLPEELAGQLWLANPMFWAAISFAADKRWPMAMSAAAVGLGFGLSLFMEPDFSVVKSAGYLTWVSSMGALAIFSAINFVRETFKQTTPSPALPL